MKAMRVEMGFFDGDTPLARTVVLIHQEEEVSEIKCERGDWFLVTRQFEEPASRMFIEAYSNTGKMVGRSAMRMGVHNSDDWEAIDLAEPYVLCFKCAIVDCESHDWETQEPITE